METVTFSDSLKNTEHIKGFSPAIYEEGMISSKSRQHATVIKAVDPKTAGTVTDIEKQIKLGSLDFSVKEIDGKKYPGIVLGVHLADNIQARHIGDIVSVASIPKEGGLFAQPIVKTFYVDVKKIKRIM